MYLIKSKQVLKYTYILLNINNLNKIRLIYPVDHSLSSSCDLQ